MRNIIAVLVLGILIVNGLGQIPTHNCAVQVFTPSNGAVLCPTNVAADPARALDLAGGVASGTFYLSLCGNDLVEYLLGVTVIDGPGPDLQIEEVNPNLAEPYLVHVSMDGVVWAQVPGPYAGAAWAGDAAIDIANTGISSVNYVRLTDTSAIVTGSTPGPDFDAIVAINYVPPLFGNVARPYADLVFSYNQGNTTTAQFLDPTKALGPPDAYRSETWVGPGNTTFTGTFFNFVSLAQGADLVVGFSGHYVIDGPGGDLIVHEYYSPEGDQFTVEASDDGVHWVQMMLVGSVSPTFGPTQPLTNNVQAFDLNGTGLAKADYIRIVSTSTGTTGASPGADLDAIEAVNFVAKVPALIPMAPLVPAGVGSILLTSNNAFPNQMAITAPAITPPFMGGSGINLGGQIELRLDLNDPILQFILFDPLGPNFVSNAITVLSGQGDASITVLLPGNPSLVGLRFYWQSVILDSAGAPIGVSNLLLTTVQ